MKISILNRFSASVVFEADIENNTVKLTLELALKSSANLDGADLRGADLCGANLCGANLYGANLYGADLRGADLYGANLRGADLRGANLYGANLYGANLYGANLRGANLDDEKLTKTPLQLNNLKWFVLISDSYLRIGCQRHSISDWEKFKDSEIEKMDSGALDFWKKWKNSILTICKAHSESEES